MFLFAAAETWWGVLGGLIPIIGLALLGFLIWRAVKDDGDDSPQS